MNLEFRMMWWQRSVVFLILYSIFLIPATVSAQATQIVPCRGLDCTFDHLIQILVNIYNFLLGLTALVALLFIIFGGVRMLYFSYWEDSAAELEAAKLTVRRAVGGFIIIITAYLVVNTTLVMLGVARGSEVGKLLIRFGLI